MPMIPNSPDPDRHKKPMWRGWQMPKFRPSLQESLEHRRTGGLGEVHVMDVVGIKSVQKEKHVEGLISQNLTRERPAVLTGGA